ncbi:vWA domain-containing protein [Litoribrevibacter albus]|uniref:VWFA domain-containing protein n=1 Tax=Litoribrevibacter albus TaxID=1473156 RepID=A0AA37SC59_9GAMM|nr:VWA domain-containing protein [Litoribrevibacter albus]GLQ32014.1 hypothetical protein GCM10007876_24930 [Litoribrevibacter albus]
MTIYNPNTEKALTVKHKPLPWTISLIMLGSLTMGSLTIGSMSGCALNEAPESGNGTSASQTTRDDLDSTQPSLTVEAEDVEAGDVETDETDRSVAQVEYQQERLERAMESKPVAPKVKVARQKAEKLSGDMAVSQGYQGAAPSAYPAATMSTATTMSIAAMPNASMSTMPAPGFVPPDLPESYPGMMDEEDLQNENYADLEINSIKSVAEQPVSTFSIDVDTGSYSNVRRILNQGVLPPKNAVRVEEMVNYFDYHYPQPDQSKAPFSVNTELAKAPWSDDHLLLRVGLQGFEPAKEHRPQANLVFLLDVSGSMSSPDKLPLLKKSLLMLTNQLTDKDKVSIVVYAGASGVVLEPTAGNEKFKIEQALQQLQAGGSTNGQQGIQLAYRLAEQSFVKDGINRVLLATDGDFNVGMSDVEALKGLIERKRKNGISLTTLGFGRGNYNDHLMEQLADVGNGNYAYIDTLHEARKVLVEELSSTLMTIAKDVKIQVEFNPQWVAEYRLIGYENRMLAREDFNNDKVDSGEIGAGHKVTAIYELALVDSQGQRLEPLRYQSNDMRNDTKVKNSPELAFLKLRYKQPSEDKSHLIEQPIVLNKEVNAFASASQDFRFAAVVAGFGQKLRNNKYLQGFEYQDMINFAQKAKGDDPFGYRNEFIQLVRLADSLSNE